VFLDQVAHVLEQDVLVQAAHALLVWVEYFLLDDFHLQNGHRRHLQQNKSCEDVQHHCENDNLRMDKYLMWC
jgi:hypothetical protein